MAFFYFSGWVGGGGGGGCGEIGIKAEVEAELGNILKMNIRAKKISPPSAREAAMSTMQHETSLKHLEIFKKLL